MEQAATIGTPKELARRMAALAQLIRDSITGSLRQEDKGGTLHQQMEAFKDVLLHTLNEEQFADMYAQTISYGLFAARCNADKPREFHRESAAFHIPRTNPFLRTMFGHIAGPDLDARVVWAVDDLAALLSRCDMAAILQDFGRRTRREDPVVHFYETFLAQYDPKMREARGVYYTPEPVVSYIVRSVDHILKKDFKLKDGLADASKIKVPKLEGKGNEKEEVHRVQILDPATGTGTFLHGVIDQIHDSFAGNKGMWAAYVSEHLLPRLFGFELLMAPYAVAHMKLGLQLAESGYDFGRDERLNIFLTNTLEEAHLYTGGLFARLIAEEANAASRVKTDVPVMVVLGNPPYSNFGKLNKGDWILRLLEDYKQNLHEKKLNLDDDFIKFFRFAQWRIERTGYGILAFISNNTYLDGITHRRMRQSLMETFSHIYILDLHGSLKRAETPPSGSVDRNVFDIQQGVSIGIFARLPRSNRKTVVHHSEIWGERKEKYSILNSSDVSSTEWKTLKPKEPYFFFVPKDFSGKEEYDQYISIRTAFPLSQNGIKTDRDSLFFDIKKDSLERRIRYFYSDEGIYEPFSSKYRVKDSSSYQLLKKRTQTSFDKTCIVPCLYRPFDVHWLYYAPGLTSRPARNVMRNLIQGGNVAILSCRQQASTGFRHVFASNVITECCSVSLKTREITSTFPLYLYRDEDELINDNAWPENVDGRRPNLSPEFVEDFAGRLKLQFISDGKGDLKKTFGPEDIFHYIYAVFHCPTYRTRYAEFLKIDFPRLPMTSSKALFRKLCALGAELVGLHLMDRHGPEIARFPVAGENEMEKVRYTEPGQGAKQGRVWINKTQYFEGVRPQVWDFHIGGYQVCAKWLKDRKGRKLSYDDLEHYRRIVSALAETIRIMRKIDKAIPEWPVQ